MTGWPTHLTLALHGIETPARNERGIVVKKLLLKFAMVTSLLLTGVMSVHGLIPNDADGDGVPNDVDQCPAENSSGFDRNGDGCIDAFTGARHIEYWGVADETITYVINETAAPNISNGSDITAIQNAIASWSAIPDTDLNVAYGGTVTQGNANAVDGVNLVTFIDNTFNFSNLVLAVGLSTSFESDTTIAGRVYRQGEIFDADMLFNPSKTFKAGGVGPGTDIQSVATHEAGHLFGLSHSTIQSSTMFYALPGGFAARSLETDDQLVYFKAYGDSIALAGANNIHGTVTDGNTSQPVPGAIVFLINSANGDTLACDYTLPDGTYTFPGIADGDYYVTIHALDGTSSVGFIQPGNINSLVASTADVTFLPESFDNAESNTDDPLDRDVVSVTNGQPVATADIVTNIDADAPEVLSARPDGTADIAVDGAIVVTFSEAIDLNTIQASFSLRNIATNAAQGGNIALIRDDMQIVFTPSPPLAFGTDFRLRFDTDLEDRSGNALAADYTIDFTTEPEPPVSIASLAPNKGVIGTTVVITGHGFDVSPAPVVKFNGINATVQSGTVGRLVVDVPVGAGTGPVTVQNADLTISNTLTFTVLTDAEFARGYESGQTILPAAPNAIAITPSGDYAYIAGAGGAHAVVVNPGLAGYLSATEIPYASELVDVATTANGKRAYAISTASSELVEINSDPSTGLLFNTVLASFDLGAAPLGIITNPTGQRAFITTNAGEIQEWDIELGSVNYSQQVGALLAPDGADFAGPMALNPAGDRLLAITGNGDLAFYDLSTASFLTDVSVGFEPRGVVVDPAGERAYVTHTNGEITVINVENVPFVVQDVATGGSVKSLVVTPASRYLYATDRELDNLKIVDLVESSSTFRSVVGVIPAASNPVDVVLSPGGEYAFSVLQGGGEVNASPRMLVTTVGIGPSLEAVSPLHADDGAMVVLSGRDFGNPDSLEVATVSFNGVIANAIAQNENRLVVTVPVGATSGPIRVRTTRDGVTQESNAFFFEVFTSDSFHGLRESVAIDSDPTPEQYAAALAMRPQGDVFFVGTSNGNVHAFDTRLGSPTFHKMIRQILVGGAPVSDLTVSADGRALFVARQFPADLIVVVDADPNSPGFGEIVQSFGMTNGGSDFTNVEASPDNTHLIVTEVENSVLEIFNVTGAADGVPPVAVGLVSPISVTDVEFNPSGLACYLSLPFANAVQMLDMNVDSANFGIIVDTQGFPATPIVPTPISLSVTPDGGHLFVLCLDNSGVNDLRYLYRLDLNGIDGTIMVGVQHDGFSSTTSLLQAERFVVSPRGDTALRAAFNEGLHLYDLISTLDIDTAGPAATSMLEVKFDPTGTRAYVADTASDVLRVFELANPAVMFRVSGHNQSGVTGQLLSSPLRVLIHDALEFGGPVAGISVNVRVTSGGGLLKSGEDFVSEMVVATDAEGYAEAFWQLGTAGVPQQVEFAALGVVGAPETFDAVSAPDPESLPLTLNEILPQDNASNVSATTAILATFSRAIDPSTVGNATFFVEVSADATRVPVTYGFTDGNRRVSLTPTQPLAFNTEYRVVYGAGIESPDDDPLSNASQALIETGAAPPLTLASISPPSALTGVSVTLAGAGFNPNPGANTVSFNGTNATPISGNTSQLLVKVPAGALPGPVTVTANATTSNAVNFTVLVPTQSPIDDVISTVNAGSGVKSCAVTPDGALCYTVSPDGDVVIPVDIAGETTFPAISVGDQPVAIVIHPEGKVAYVANFNSSSVSIIDVNPASGSFNTVISTITVGTNPSDLAVFPDGDRVLVVNAGSGDLSVIDGDATSNAYHTVIATVNQGSGAKSCAVSPDGARYYVGTTTGFIVVDASSFGVIATVNSGSGTKSCAVSPDGTLLFILTTTGNILIVDVQPGSASENQVIATVGSGAGAKSLAVSPDGGLLFIIQEDSDVVLVIAINVIPGVSVADAAAPSFTVQTTLIDEVTVGSDPSFVAVDPTGTGKLFITNPGDKTLSIINASDVPLGPVAAIVEVTPSTLKLNSNGLYVTAEIQLALPYFTEEIDPATVKLQNSIPAIPELSTLTDANADGIKELTVKFDRAAFQAILPQGEFVDVSVTGDVRNRTFLGTDTIRTLRPNVVNPHGGSNILPGAAMSVQWTTPASFASQITAADIHFSSDNGATWTQLANHIANSGSFNWTTPADAYMPQCRVMITLWKGTEVFGQGINQDTFSIAAPVAVGLKSFEAAVEDGDAVLRWQTNFESDTDGFQIVRSGTQDGVYTRINSDLIAAKGDIAGASYEYRDASIRANQTYWYKLVEVTAGDDASQFGPYSVTFKVTNSLDQNMPNPFNPATTIRYSIAQDENVSLVVYDVAGRQVRTLVENRQRADVYKVTWDGVNDHGERVASGMYFYRLAAGKFVETRKMMLLK